MNYLSTQEVDVFDRTIIKYDTFDVVQAHPDHAEYLAERLRPDDLKECEALGKTPIEALMSAFEHDRATLTAVDKNNKPIAMFGIGEDLDMPYIWLLGTEDLIKKSKRDFIKHSKNWVEELVKITDGCAGNIVYKYNRMAVRWLRWVGANFLKEIEINGEPFYQFIIINNNNLEEY